MPRKYYQCNVHLLKGCFPAKWWGEIKRLSGMEGSFESRDNFLQSVHPLEGARGLSADNLANYTNTAFLAPMEVFERLPTFYLREGEMFLCLRAELWMMMPHRYQGFLSFESYALLIQLKHKDQQSPRMGRMRNFWCHPLWMSWIPPFVKVGCPYLGKRQISSLSLNKELSKTPTSTFALSPIRLSFPIALIFTPLYSPLSVILSRFGLPSVITTPIIVCAYRENISMHDQKDVS